MISTIISLKSEKKFIEKKLDKKYSFSQIMNYLDQMKKFKDLDEIWKDTTLPNSREPWNFRCIEVVF